MHSLQVYLDGYPLRTHEASQQVNPKSTSPIQTLVNAGIQEILLVKSGESAGDFLRLLGNGCEFGLKQTFPTPRDLESLKFAAVSQEDRESSRH